MVPCASGERKDGEIRCRIASAARPVGARLSRSIAPAPISSKAGSHATRAKLQLRDVSASEKG
jgi:hypothetical protein